MKDIEDGVVVLSEFSNKLSLTFGINLEGPELIDQSVLISSKLSLSAIITFSIIIESFVIEIIYSYSERYK
jgi:hypothetical protein